MRKSIIWSIAACASVLNLAGCNISGDASTTTVVDAESAQGLEPLVGRVVTVYLLDAPESPSTTTANWPMRMEDTGGASAGIDPRRFMGLVLGDGQPLRARGVLHEVRGGWLVLRSPGDDAGVLGEVIVPAREVRAVFAEAGAEARTEAPDPEPFATTTEP